jgi:hypothetical protein
MKPRIPSSRSIVSGRSIRSSIFFSQCRVCLRLTMYCGFVMQMKDPLQADFL